ncbi:MAG: DNA repair protein RecO [Flavobacteriaceae bacterium]|nr:DNA repair protein RecO [Flavobacteriaceae bacterium]|tara:strand:- start:5638 stop:6354 length:717 start_codon:yes stop_codon:yes gene_type:complete
MIVSTKGIVLNKFSYKESSLIVRIITRKAGICSFIVRVGKGKKKKNIFNYFHPLSILEIDFVLNNKRDLHFFKEVDLKVNFKSIYIDNNKSVVVMFLSEILSKTLKFQEKDLLLYDFIETSIIYFDESDFTPYFHLVFLIRLTQYFGFYPDSENKHYDFFDLEQGIYINIESGNYLLKGNELTCFNNILGTNFDNIKSLTLSSMQRKKVLDNIILYYRLHIDSFNSIKSLDILRKLFE